MRVFGLVLALLALIALASVAQVHAAPQRDFDDEDFDFVDEEDFDFEVDEEVRVLADLCSLQLLARILRFALVPS